MEWRSDKPCELERPTANTDGEILVEWGAKGNPLDIILVTEESFGGFVESFGNVIDRVGRSVSGVLEFLWLGVSLVETCTDWTYPPGTLLLFDSRRRIPRIYLARPKIVNERRFSVCSELTIRWRDFLDYKWIRAPDSIGADIQCATACVGH